MKIAVLFVVLLQVTYQGLVYSDFHSHFGNFLAWKAQRNQSIGKGAQKLSNFRKFISQIGNFPQKILKANLSHAKPQPWHLTNEPHLESPIGLIVMIGKRTIIPQGWRLLTYEEVVPIHKDLIELMHEQWAIIGLENGRVYGEGYQFKMESKDGSECGQRFIIEDRGDEY